MIGRRAFLLSAPALALAGAAYPFVVESNWLEVCVRWIPLPKRNLGSLIRILHLSDLHASELVPLSLIESAFRLGLESRPDLICLTGDFVTYGDRCDFGKYQKLLSRLTTAAPAFACLGNHDVGSWAVVRGGFKSPLDVTKLLTGAGITVLRNEARRIRSKGEEIEVVGLGDLWANDTRPEKAFAALPPDSGITRIVICHNPDSKDLLRPFRWDLMLSGHTHGGQVVLPLLGTRFAPVVDQRFIAGLYSWGGRKIYVTRGVGNLYGVRLNCRPEVSVLDLAG